MSARCQIDWVETWDGAVPVLTLKSAPSRGPIACVAVPMLPEAFEERRWLAWTLLKAQRDLRGFLATHKPPRWARRQP